MGKTRKGAIHLRHLVLSAQTLAGGNQFHRALLNLAVVAFWGMARMSELTYVVSTEPLREASSVLTLGAVFIRGPKIDNIKENDTLLFGYNDQEGNHVHLTKAVVCCTLSEIWARQGCAGLSGHSFQVGEASFRNATGTPIKRILLLGCWTSDCYLLYLRQYSPAELEETLKLWGKLNAFW
ncbi:hypothetical protein MJO28_013014 [Puccinia striiformis f. sp. tritici]|uniref:Uncharacterized protein n=1 Tax=Puccinia striiformis f. sp. tritici TaxID=168172 RepID=A0ACC0DX14_9BASI|nr:hypothetical protein MJO28_013014 [Puccinia striiformis f. sp. tritici]